jgi:hypothetical protein
VVKSSETVLPKKVRIYDTWYNIKARPDPESEDDFGLVNLRTATITLSDLPPLTYKLRVLWHEILHIEQSSRCAELDESEATRISQLINQTLLDNPELVAIYVKLQRGAL